MESPTFQVEAPKAGAVVECAKYIQSVAELGLICDQLYAGLEKIMQGRPKVKAQLQCPAN